MLVRLVLYLDYVMNYFNMVKEIVPVRIGILTSCWYGTYRVVPNVPTYGILILIYYYPYWSLVGLVRTTHTDTLWYHEP